MNTLQMNIEIAEWPGHEVTCDECTAAAPTYYLDNSVRPLPDYANSNDGMSLLDILAELEKLQ